VRPLSDGELIALQATQEAAMPDECMLLRRVETGTDAYGMPEVEWVASPPYPCGLADRASREVLAGTQVPLYDARLRLPLALDGAIDEADRVRITKRFGQALASPAEYEFIGLPRRGPSGLVADLRKVAE
jgi:hypothetical protein